MKALSDIVMLDLTHMLSGPFAAMLLADLGAQTIKVEPPGGGEMTRGLLAEDPRYAYKGMGPYFRTLNRNKKSVSIDLKRDEGRALFHELAAKADIVVNNFRPGVPERLGIDHATLAALNPRIVTCSVTGFGEEGPDCDRTAFDVVAQGYGGGMSITGEAGGPPIRAGVPMGDLSSGLFGAVAMLAALHAREVTRRGQHIDLSMQDCQVSLLSYIAAMHLLSGEVPRQFGNAHPIYVPYNAFPTRDRWLIIAVVKDDQWARLRDVLGNPALKDARFDGYEGRRDHREEVDGGITEALAVQRLRRVAGDAARSPRALRAGQRRGPCARGRTGAGPRHGGRDRSPGGRLLPHHGQPDQAERDAVRELRSAAAARPAHGRGAGRPLRQEPRRSCPAARSRRDRLKRTRKPEEENHG